MRINIRICLSMSAVLLMVAVPAMSPGFGDDFQECKSVSNNELGDIRGGYVADNGMELSFGIAKMVLVNGVPLVSNTLNFNVGASMDPTAGNSVSKSVSQIQSGLGNSIDPSVLNGMQAGTFSFIQNSMDRAVIQNTTQLNATIAVRNLTRDLNLSSMLSQQLINARH